MPFRGDFVIHLNSCWITYRQLQSPQIIHQQRIWSPHRGGAYNLDFPDSSLARTLFLILSHNKIRAHNGRSRGETKNSLTEHISWMNLCGLENVTVLLSNWMHNIMFKCINRYNNCLSKSSRKYFQCVNFNATGTISERKIEEEKNKCERKRKWKWKRRRNEQQTQQREI